MTLAVRLGGAGGQGIVLAGLILAEAAALAGRRVVCTQAYGPESRGGASRSDVIISDQPIVFPMARRLDVLVALTQEACDRSWGALAPNGLAIIDAGRVTLPPRGPAECHALPVTGTARLVTGSTRSANIVALGAVCGLTGVVPRPALEEAVARRVPSASRGLNLAALGAGERLGVEARAAVAAGGGR
ncbi:MAG TPA: 2-oxoacid:acceptor oxidoreductase family protein [bacterium]|nr:2-oxoacid:acceptor oxidoreductase family protein [bacterium]